jgi:hypothetical protein
MSHKSGAIIKNDKNGLYSWNVINVQSLAGVLGNPLRVLSSTNPVSLKSATTVPSVTFWCVQHAIRFQSAKTFSDITMIPTDHKHDWLDCSLPYSVIPWAPQNHE